jgi:hypothetical protein
MSFTGFGLSDVSLIIKFNKLFIYLYIFSVVSLDIPIDVYFFLAKYYHTFAMFSYP